MPPKISRRDFFKLFAAMSAVTGLSAGKPIHDEPVDEPTEEPDEEYQRGPEDWPLDDWPLYYVPKDAPSNQS